MPPPGRQQWYGQADRRASRVKGGRTSREWTRKGWIYDKRARTHAVSCLFVTDIWPTRGPCTPSEIQHVRDRYARDIYRHACCLLRARTHDRAHIRLGLGSFLDTITTHIVPSTLFMGTKCVNGNMQLLFEIKYLSSVWRENKCTKKSDDFKILYSRRNCLRIINIYKSLNSKIYAILILRNLFNIITNMILVASTHVKEINIFWWKISPTSIIITLIFQLFSINILIFSLRNRR